MSELVPVYRIEEFIQAIIDGSAAPKPAVEDVELYLAKIAGDDVELPVPTSRVDFYLAKIAGEDVELPEPVERIDFWLAQIAGMDVETPEPVYRIEFFLDQWAHGGGELPDDYVRQLGFTYNNNAYFEITGFRLRGSDTVKCSFSALKACNVWGCYQSTSATDNYDLYVSTTTAAKYLRYGDGTYRSDLPPESVGQRIDAVFTPTGTSGMPVDSTWEEHEFESANDMTVGTTSKTSTSSKLVGDIYGDFVVVGRLKLIPCRRKSDDALGYYDTYSQTLFLPVGTGLVSLGDA